MATPVSRCIYRIDCPSRSCRMTSRFSVMDCLLGITHFGYAASTAHIGRAVRLTDGWVSSSANPRGSSPDEGRLAVAGSGVLGREGVYPVLSIDTSRLPT
jgi:hypothetical protein